MANKKGGIMELMYQSIMPKVYGIGAAVVIVGALFKILHWAGANEMLMIGLFTEAAIFFLSAFEPKHPEPDWSKVYPELAEDWEEPEGEKPRESTRITNVPKIIHKKSTFLAGSGHEGTGSDLCRCRESV